MLRGKTTENYLCQHTKPSSIVIGSLFNAHLFSSFAAELPVIKTTAVDNNKAEKRISVK